MDLSRLKSLLIHGFLLLLTSSLLAQESNTSINTTKSSLIPLTRDDVLAPTDSSIDPRTGSPLDPNFPIDPIDQPYDPINNYGYYPFPISTRNGSGERVAMEVLFQTLSYYGVAHIAEKKGTQIEFKILKSRYGYWTNLTKLDVSYAVREFSRYLTAHLCGQSTMANFYQAFAQVPMEEIGLRFKYDFAWALLGNSLPKEPNELLTLNTRWKALQQILSSPSTAQTMKADGRELKAWATSISDVVQILTRLNRLMCYVDIRPNPRDEIKKRIVINKFLEMDRQLNEHYQEYKDILDAAQKTGRAAQIQSVTQPNPLPPGQKTP